MCELRSIHFFLSADTILYAVYTCTPFVVQTMSNHNQLNPCMFKCNLCNHQKGIWNFIMQVTKISNRINVHITFNTDLQETVNRA